MGGVMTTAWERLLTKVSIDPDGCWNFLGHVSRSGYGQIGANGKTAYAHRVAYEAFTNQEWPGLDIDHLCRNRRCCNPLHLEAVTRQQNVLRGISPLANNARKTHCKRGHEFTDENTRHDGRGRQCRTCDAIRLSRKRTAS